METDRNDTAEPSLTHAVREKYGALARRATAGEAVECGERGEPCGCGGAGDPISSNLYAATEMAGLPATAVQASLGCGNPTALAELRAGETVLDLGSGGGIDVLLSARRVGPTGKVYGLDMTDEMLALARENQRTAGIENVEFLRGQIEAVPLRDASVDVVISNCVINLSLNKEQVLREAYRVLRPGGRFAVSDVVIRGSIPVVVRRNMELWVGCIAGALEEEEFLRLLGVTGFEDATIEPTRIYEFDEARTLLASAGLESVAREVSGRVLSAFIRGRKPAVA